jgi:alpha-glucosidase (family GH31 glycosyl hydrolase)
MNRILVLFIFGLLSCSTAQTTTSTPRVQFDSVKNILSVSNQYQVFISRNPFQLKVMRGDFLVIETAPNWPRLQFPHPKEDQVRKIREKLEKKKSKRPLPEIPERWFGASQLISADWSESGQTLKLDIRNDDGAVEFKLELKPHLQSIEAHLQTVHLNSFVKRAEIGFILESDRNWYGHGEDDLARQPWPLNHGSISEDDFSPSNYKMLEPFWYSSAGGAVWFGMNHRRLSVNINRHKDGLLRIGVWDQSPFDFEILIAKDAHEAYDDFISRVGKPRQSQAPLDQFATPVWNTWAQFYAGVNQKDVLKYAQGLKDSKLPGHGIQIDDRWESDYGDYSFDPKKFPSPKAMVKDLKNLGFETSVWVTLWVGKTSKNYEFLKNRGFLLKNHQSESCSVTWWNGEAGIIDVGNPEARKWIDEKLRSLQTDFGISGFKFDTRFFDDQCLPAPGTNASDYLTFGAELVNQFDLQGVGVRLHWGMQPYGFITRELDKPTDWNGLGVAIRQMLALSSVGYPFLATDMIGGSFAMNPPEKEVLIRWAEAAAYTPIMYSSSSPLGAKNPRTGFQRNYDQETVSLYRNALLRHEHLVPYLKTLIDESVKTGAPIVRSLYYDFPSDDRAGAIADQWMFGPTLMVAPVLNQARERKIYLPAGTWVDVLHGGNIQGPTTLRRYSAQLDEVPVFVRRDQKNSDEILRLFSN